MIRVLRRATAVLALLACVGGLAACTQAPQASPTNPLTGAPKVPSGLEQFYGQKLTWGECGDVVKAKGVECARVKAPVNYAEPQGATLELQLARLKATGKARGSLFLNPGGPGASGVDIVANLAQALPAPVRENFDIVAFDPRGVGHSTPITCVDDATLNAFLDGTLEPAPADRAWQVARQAVDKLGEAATEHSLRAGAQVAALGQACAAKSGDLLAHVDTVSVARDLDMLRNLVGDDKLSYIGYSYGTFLGATYIDLFPANVGRVALDGILAAGMSMDEVVLSQAKGMAASLRHFVDFCLSGASCPLKGPADTAMAQIASFLTGLDGQPLPTATASRPLTAATAGTGIIGSLYAEASYPALREALRQALEHRDGTQLQRIADQYTGRNTDGTFSSNQNEAFLAVNALDYPVQGDPASWRSLEATLARIAPFMSDDSGASALAQYAWPVHSSAKRTWASGKGAAPVLLISTTHDPATPHEMALQTHKHLQGSRLVTLEGWDHTTLASGSECVNDVLADYLVDGVVPEEDVTCD